MRYSPKVTKKDGKIYIDGIEARKVVEVMLDRGLCSHNPQPPPGYVKPTITLQRRNGLCACGQEGIKKQGRLWVCKSCWAKAEATR